MSLASNQPVLVTGVNGFVAAWVALTLLRKGYSVRGTSRSQAKFDALLSHNDEFAKYAKEGKLTLSIIEDVASSDFSKAMDGVEIVMHTASPFHMAGGPAEETYLIPALKGTRNVIEAAHKAGSVTDFVVTSSFAAVLDMGDKNMPLNSKSFTEADWNPITYDEARSTDVAPVAYCASKKVAEEAAYTYQKDHGLEGKMRVASLNPPMIFGPFVHPVDSLESLNESEAQAWKIASGKCGNELPPTGFPAMADVRDVAAAHVAAAEHKAQGRFLLYGGPYDNETLAAQAQRDFPDSYKGPKDVDASKGVASDPKLFRLDTTRARSELGIQFHTPQQTFYDMFEAMFTFKPRA